MEEDRIQVEKASNSTIWTYGFGSISVGIKNNLLGTWLLIYYNQVLGLDALLVSSAIAIALVVDAISDPFVGIWSDRVRSRWGRRHPFMYASIIPFSLCYYLILQDPGDISDGEMFTRLLVLMILMRIAMTFYEVPRAALVPELSKDYDQRNNFSGVGMALGWLGGAGISFIHMEFFLGDSYFNTSGYQLLAFWGGLGIFISTAFTAIGTHKHIPNLHVPPERSFHIPTFLKEAKETLSNKAWIVLFLSGCIYSLLVGVDTGAVTYYSAYLWQWQPNEISVYSLWQAASVICIALFAPMIAYGRNNFYRTFTNSLTTFRALRWNKLNTCEWIRCPLVDSFIPWMSCCNLRLSRFCLHWLHGNGNSRGCRKGYWKKRGRASWNCKCLYTQTCWCWRGFDRWINSILGRV